MVPKGWISTIISKVSLLVTKGATPTTYGHKFVDASEESVRFIGAYNCTCDGRFKTDSEKWISKEADGMLKRSRLNDGDSIVCIVGNTIGSSFLVCDDILPANINQNVALVRPDLEHVIPSYLHMLITSSYIQEQVKQEASTQAQPSLSLKQVGDFRINLPTIKEQRKIAQILSTWDKAIATTERLLANKQQQKKALMQSLLTGKQRFAGFEGEWQIVKLGSVAEMNSGGTPKSTIEDYYGGQIPWVSIADMTSKGKWIDSTVKYLTQLGLDNSSARIYPVNTVLYAMYASIGECSIAKVELASSQAILGIRPSAQLHFEFLYFYLCSLKDKIKLQGQQGTQANLNAGMVKEFLIPLPSINEQRQIASVLCLADNELTIIQLQLENLKQQKKALMQQLLTGKRRVKVDEAAA